MKKFTHPQLSYTAIRQKDSSFEGKYWSYLRSSLILDVASKKHNSQKLNYIVYSNALSFNTKSIQVLKDGVSFWKK